MSTQLVSSKLSSIDTVLLPIELLNEPYADVDNGFRPEIIKKRSNFIFEVGGGFPVLEKNRSRVSILNIYDTYGLKITLSFIKHLWTKKDESARTLRLFRDYIHMSRSSHYLGCDTHSLDSNGEDNVLSIIQDLEDREANWPVVVEIPNLSVSMPIELIAQITNSVRLSKAVTAEVWRLRCVLPDLHILSSEERTVRHPDGSYSYTNDSYCRFILRQIEGRYVITCHRRRESSDDEEAEKRIVGIPLSCYRWYFDSLGADVRKHMHLLLDSLLSPNIDVCAWLVQLLGDCTHGEDCFDSHTFESMDEIRITLHRLIKQQR